MAKGLANCGFDIDLSRAQIHERSLARILMSPDTDKLTIEVKDDGKSVDTGNVFIEFRQNGRPSGLATTTASHWAFHIRSTGCWIIRRTEEVRELTMIAYRQGRVKRGGDFNNYEGVTLPANWLIWRNPQQLLRDRAP